MSEGQEQTQPVVKELKNEGKITFTGLCRAGFETIALSRTERDKVNVAGAMTLIGMKAAFPEHFSNVKLRSNPNLKLFNCFTWLGVELNDCVDIAPFARKGNQQWVIENIFQWWKKAIRATKTEADSNPEERQQKRQLMHDYQREILFLERVLRKEPDAIDLSGVIRYREIMNAISLTHNAAALLGVTTLASRLKSIPKEKLSWQILERKYNWMIDGDPSNETERRLCALYNMIMGIQVIDDWQDVVIDRKLGLQNIATKIIEDKEGSDKGKDKVQELTDSYFKKAETFRVTKTAGKGAQYFIKLLKSIMHKFPSTFGGRRERLINGGEKILW